MSRGTPHHLLAVEVAQLQMAQFIAAYRGGIERGENRPMLQVGGPVQDACDLLRTHHGRQPGTPFRSRNLLVKPRLFENSDVEKLECAPVHLNGSPCVLPVVKQMEQVAADMVSLFRILV